MFDKKWVKVMALAMGLPSTILFSSWSLMQLAEKGVISKTVAVVLFLIIISSLLYLIASDGFKKKN